MRNRHALWWEHVTPASGRPSARLKKFEDAFEALCENIHAGAPSGVEVADRFHRLIEPTAIALRALQVALDSTAFHATHSSGKTRADINTEIDDTVRVVQNQVDGHRLVTRPQAEQQIAAYTARAREIRFLKEQHGRATISLKEKKAAAEANPSKQAAADAYAAAVEKEAAAALRLKQVESSPVTMDEVRRQGKAGAAQPQL